MNVTNTTLLNAYADIAQQTYAEPTEQTTTPDFPAGSFGTYTEITQIIDGPLGFQARAFLNSTNNELVIAFAGTEGLQARNLSGSEFFWRSASHDSTANHARNSVLSTLP